MSSSYGERVRMTIFGASHGPAIGVTLEGIPPGTSIDFDQLQNFLDRRAPGHSQLSTPRKEADRPEFLSGFLGNTTCGTPITAIIRNSNTRSGDYDNLHDCPRPGHADFPAQVKYKGFQDVRGGGHFSGRLTACLCMAGGICMQILEQQGITIGAHIEAIETVHDRRFDPVSVEKEELFQLKSKSFPVLDDGCADTMTQAVLQAKAEQDSVGGIIECAAVGLPVGWGDPMFGGMENRIAQIAFGIPAIRGIEFGTGFAAAAMRGSRHNDPYAVEDGTIRTKTNHHGGVLGGITSGMPLIFRVAVKPTPSIGLEQESISMSKMEGEPLTVHGRHDPCIVPRAVPVVEAAAAVAIYDAYLCSL